MKRFVPGFFQRSIVDVGEELAEQEDYIKFWEDKLLDAQNALDELMGKEPDESEEPEEHEEWAERMLEQEEKIEHANRALIESRDELTELQRLARLGYKPDQELFSLMLAMVNTNFADTFKRHVCTSSHTGPIFDVEFVGDAVVSAGDFPCNARDRPIFLKVEQPGHLFGVLIFPEDGVCEIWNTAEVSSRVEKYFVAALPRWYTVICINAQLQVKWCPMGQQNVYIVPQRTGQRPLVNVYCQSWPFFFAYMRCVKRYSALDVLKFLSCLTDLQKTTLIDTFTTALANRGDDVRYIREINDDDAFKRHVRKCSPRLDLSKSIRYAGRSDFDADEYNDEVRRLATDAFVKRLRDLTKR